MVVSTQNIVYSCVIMTIACMLFPYKQRGSYFCPPPPPACPLSILRAAQQSEHHYYSHCRDEEVASKRSPSEEIVPWRSNPGFIHTAQLTTLLCPVREPHGCVLEMQLVWLRNWIFSFISS